jgi:hypothetical protein
MKRTGLVVLFLGLLLFVQAARADWEPARRITWNSGYSGDPQIAVDSAGRIHVAWCDYSNENFPLIFYKNSTDGGASWSPAKMISTNGLSASRPAIAVDAANNVHVVWQEAHPHPSSVYYKRSTDAGATWSGYRPLDYVPIGGCHEPDIAGGSLNIVHAVWYIEDENSFSEVFYGKSTDRGAAWLPDKRLTWTTGTSEAPAIIADLSGNLHVVWQDNTPGNAEIYYRKSTDRGVTWLTTKRLTWNSGDSWAPQLAADLSGYLHLVWYDFTPGATEIFYQRSTDQGTTWSEFKRLSWTSGDSASPDIVTSAPGNIHVVWNDNTSGNSEIDYRKSTDNGATWLAKYKLSAGSGESNNATISAAASGNLQVVWSEDTPGNFEIYYRKFVK